METGLGEPKAVHIVASHICSMHAKADSNNDLGHVIVVKHVDIEGFKTIVCFMFISFVSYALGYRERGRALGVRRQYLRPRSLFLVAPLLLPVPFHK